METFIPRWWDVDRKVEVLIDILKVLPPFKGDISDHGNETRYGLLNGSVWIKWYNNGTTIKVSSTCEQGDHLCRLVFGKEHKYESGGYPTWILTR